MASPLCLEYVGHATILLRMEGIRLLTDPILRDRVGFLRRHTDGIDPARYRQVDAVLLSHLHLDHLDPPSLRMLDSETAIIAPRGAVGYLRQRGFDHVIGVAAGEIVSIGSIQIKAIPALHGRTRYPFGPSAEPLGYVVSGQRRVYFAGDTDYFSEMVNEVGRPDIALLPVWGWGFRLGKHHLDPLGAAEAAAAIRPYVAVPVHWGTFRPIGIGWLEPSYLTEPPNAFARHTAEIAPDIAVRIVPPGGAMMYDNDGMVSLHS